VERAVAALAEWDIEMVETHHRAKVDAPSGTALRLAEVASRARAGDTRLVHGREGRPGPRGPIEIGMHAVRGGDVIGDHVVHLFGGGERLELTHRATSRDVFAHGAIAAARFVAGKPAGTYTLADVTRGSLRT
jgi:4-hydroxy-tetrahydrodipicolinate reductase